MVPPLAALHWESLGSFAPGRWSQSMVLDDNAEPFVASVAGDLINSNSIVNHWSGGFWSPVGTITTVPRVRAHARDHAGDRSRSIRRVSDGGLSVAGRRHTVEDRGERMERHDVGRPRRAEADRQPRRPVARADPGPEGGRVHAVRRGVPQPAGAGVRVGWDLVGSVSAAGSYGRARRATHPSATRRTGTWSWRASRLRGRGWPSSSGPERCGRSSASSE